MFTLIRPFVFRATLFHYQIKKITPIFDRASHKVTQSRLARTM